MNRFLVPALDSSSNSVTITDLKLIHHLRDVLRLKAGEAVSVFDGKGNDCAAAIVKISADSVELVVKNRKVSVFRKVSVTIACAIPKKSRFDDIVDKLTQLGVDRIIPLKTKRTIVKLTKEKEGARHKRWIKIALSASQQSQRSVLPHVEALTDIKDVIKRSAEFDLKLIPTLEGERKGFKEVFSHPHPYRNILIFIGPEGDFTADEINLARKNGFIPVSLGTSVLRVETAAVAVASFINLNENN
ncbi:MAG: RsmE family RNA methyltransferase [Candidatus Omnitrophica bacterium]|nr:RsmE family RNA methyltransferase [Candidatus Omnitrophota bacterium]